MLKIIPHQFYVHIELSRPSQRNALSLNLISQLTEQFKKLSLETQVRAVVLTGEGSVFCAGADLQDMQASINKTTEQNLAEAHILYDLFQAAWDLPQPLLLRVQGSVMGGALGLVAVSDWVVAEPMTQFCFSEVKLGLAPAVISDFILRKMSLANVQDLMLLAPNFTAVQAMQRGFVHQLSEPAQSLAELERKISQVINLSPEGVRATKALLRSYQVRSQSYRDSVTQLIAQLRLAPQGQEGVKAFFEKRLPSWVTAKGEQ